MPFSSRHNVSTVAALLIAAASALHGQIAQARTIQMTQDGYVEGAQLALSLELPDTFDVSKERVWTNAIQRATVSFTGNSKVPSFRHEWTQPNGALKVIMDGFQQGESTLGDQAGEGVYVVSRADFEFSLVGFQGNNQSPWQTSLFTGWYEESQGLLNVVSQVPEAGALPAFVLGLAGVIAVARRRSRP